MRRHYRTNLHGTRAAMVAEFARMGADVTVLDCAPNKSLGRWASYGRPKGITLHNDIGRAEIILILSAANGNGKVAIVGVNRRAKLTPYRHPNLMGWTAPVPTVTRIAVMSHDQGSNKVRFHHV